MRRWGRGSQTLPSDHTYALNRSTLEGVTPPAGVSAEPSVGALSSMFPIGIVEVACAVLYAIPQTAVLGAVLTTAYLGGAVATHVRASDPFLPPIVLGILVWVGLYLRDERLRPLLPLRRLESRG